MGCAIALRSEFIASLMQAVAAESGQWILAANDHAQNAVAALQPVAGVAFSPCRSQFSAQQDQSADHLRQIVVDLIGPVVERAVESRDCRTAAIRTHCGTLSGQAKIVFGPLCRGVAGGVAGIGGELRCSQSRAQCPETDQHPGADRKIRSALYQRCGVCRSRISSGPPGSLHLGRCNGRCGQSAPERDRL